MIMIEIYRDGRLIRGYVVDSFAEADIILGDWKGSEGAEVCISFNNFVKL